MRARTLACGLLLLPVPHSPRRTGNSLNKILALERINKALECPRWVLVDSRSSHLVKKQKTKTKQQPQLRSPPQAWEAAGGEGVACWVFSVPEWSRQHPLPLCKSPLKSSQIWRTGSRRNPRPFLPSLVLEIVRFLPPQSPRPASLSTF